MKPFQYFQNKKCEYFPCHKGGDGTFNCLFCYCPLYVLGNRCGGNFEYLENGVKSCEHCLIPHKLEGYEYIQKRIGEVIHMAKQRKIRLAALDLDDTVLRSDGTLSPAMRQAMVDAIGRGIEVVAASGRAFHTLPLEVLSIPGLRYAITANGTAIYRVSDGIRIHSETLDPEAVNRILQVASRFEKVPLEAVMQGKVYAPQWYLKQPGTFGVQERYCSYIQKTRIPVEDMIDFGRKHCRELDSVQFVCKNHELKKAVRDAIASETDMVQQISSEDFFLEICSCKAGKEAGMAYLCMLLDIPRECTTACGNAGNDIGMIQFAGIGAAVSNASADCKASADMLIGSNDEDGVAMFLNCL